MTTFRNRTLIRAGIGASALLVLLAGCATVEEAAVEATAKTYHATLTGAQEPGGAGDPDGAGKAEVSVSGRLDQVCYEVKDLSGLGTITMAHIHRGAPGENGPPVMTLKVANEGGFKGCDTAPEWLQDALKTNFSGYYVNVHTSEYPNGAIRGQLGM